MSDESKAAEHPAPWRWVPRSLAGDPGELVDASGDQVVRVEADEVRFASPVVRELIRLAPEMEQALRGLRDLHGTGGEYATALRERIDSRIALIIAALDAARKA